MLGIDITPYVVPKVAEAVLSDKQISFIYGWRDGGKSTTAFNVLLWKCLLDKHFRFAHCRAKYNELAGSTFQTLQDCIKEMNLQDYFIIKNDRFRIINKKNPNNYFFGASADQPDKIRSTANLNGFICDEAHDLKELDFSSLLGTLRENKKLSAPTKAIFIFNNDKVSTESFIATKFFNEKSPMYEAVNRTHVNYLDNPFVLKEKTYKKLINVCMGDIGKYNQLMSGAFIQEKVDNPFFYALDKNIHYKDEKYILHDNKQLILSFDFNNNPCTLLIGQVVDKKISIIDLILADENTMQGYSPLESCCLRFKLKYIESGLITSPYLIVTGDASGRSKQADNVANKNFYTKIRALLGLGESQLKVRKANISHSLSREICNAMIYNTDFSIYKSAYLAVQDMQTAYVDENGTLNKAKKEHGLHITDTVRYFCDCVLNFNEWQNYLAYYSKK